MLNVRAISNNLERSPLLFSAVHLLGGGTDINRRVFVNLVHPGDVVVEIGANVGIYTALFSRLVGEQGEVHAFEPVTANFDRLSACIKSLGATNVSIQQMGVGNSCGEREIVIPGNDLQQASFAVHRHGSWSTATETRRELVAVTSMDVYLRQAGVRDLNFIKVDVEGAEMTVLEGGRECLTRSKPILHMEINPDWLRDFGTAVGDLIDLLTSFGYRFSYQVDGAQLKGYRKLNGTDLSALRSGQLSGDFLFSAKSLWR